jgi:hypothetical protein
MHCFALQEEFLARARPVLARHMFSVMSGSVEVGIDATHDSWSEPDPIHPKSQPRRGQPQIRDAVTLEPCLTTNRPLSAHCVPLTVVEIISFSPGPGPITRPDFLVRPNAARSLGRVTEQGILSVMVCFRQS